jgi:hypothetical protein
MNEKISSRDIVRKANQEYERRKIHTKCLGGQSTGSTVMLEWILGE